MQGRERRSRVSGLSLQGGVVVELKPYAADPEAVRLLQQADADFNRAVARRKANEEIGPIRR
jgi:hypothetical protein